MPTFWEIWAKKIRAVPGIQKFLQNYEIWQKVELISIVGLKKS
jgi:hypothetical protein